jgi:hypothetical protein
MESRRARGLQAQREDIDLFMKVFLTTCGTPEGIARKLVGCGAPDQFVTIVRWAYPGVYTDQLGLDLTSTSNDAAKPPFMGKVIYHFNGFLTDPSNPDSTREFIEFYKSTDPSKARELLSTILGWQDTTEPHNP